jgi:hypothetical protein
MAARTLQSITNVLCAKSGNPNRLGASAAQSGKLRNLGAGFA